MSDVKAARALGWASFGIGLMEILASRTVERMLGVGDHRGLLTALGLRECAAGAAIHTAGETPNAQLAGGVWSRVAGDAMDLALLGAAARKSDNPGGLSFATVMVVGITALDVLYAVRLQQTQSRATGRIANAARRATGRSQSLAGRIGGVLAGV